MPEVRGFTLTPTRYAASHRGRLAATGAPTA